MDISVILSKMSTFLILLLIGYVFAKEKITGPEFNKVCSKLVINLFLTATILDSVMNKEVAMTGSTLVYGTAMMYLMFSLCLVLGHFSPRLALIKGGDTGLYRVLVCYMNTALFAFPIIREFYGGDALFYASLSTIPFNLTLYTYGIIQLQRRDVKSKINLRSILSVPLIATLIAVLLFVLKLHVPEFIANTVSTTAAATVPLSMLLVGSSLGAVSIKAAFTDKTLYKLTFVRLIICPLLIWLVFRGLMPDRMMLGTLVILSAAPMGIVATPLSISYGRDGVEASKGIFLSTILSMLTIPLLVILLKL